MKILEEEQELLFVPDTEVEQVINTSNNFTKATEESVEDFCPCIQFPEVVRASIQSEKSAIEQYNLVLDRTDISEDIKEKFKEIISDEKDHIIVLSNLLNELYKAEYPGSGEK